MKGNEALNQALLTGVQRVVKESIFSQFNNPKVYTVISRQYAPYFGLTQKESQILLNRYGLELDNCVFDNYLVNTSANFLIRKGLKEASGINNQSLHNMSVKLKAAI